MKSARLTFEKKPLRAAGGSGGRVDGVTRIVGHGRGILDEPRGEP
jgi:hypothetical protein